MIGRHSVRPDPWPRPRNRHSHPDVRWGEDQGLGGFTDKGSGPLVSSEGSALAS